MTEHMEAVGAPAVEGAERETIHITYTREQLDDLIKGTVAQGASADQVEMLLYQARRTGLDPLSKQICLHWMGPNRQCFVVAQVDGMAIVAGRTGHYAGQVGPLWCDRSGEWRDVWLGDLGQVPIASKAGVLRHDFTEPLWRVAKYSEYVPRNQHGQPLGLWATKPAMMLGLCAISMALRAAFPEQLSGIYTVTELMESMPGAPPVPQEQAPPQPVPQAPPMYPGAYPQPAAPPPPQPQPVPQAPPPNWSNGGYAGPHQPGLQHNYQPGPGQQQIAQHAPPPGGAVATAPPAQAGQRMLLQARPFKFTKDQDLQAAGGEPWGALVYLPSDDYQVQPGDKIQVVRKPKSDGTAQTPIPKVVTMCLNRIQQTDRQDCVATAQIVVATEEKK